MQSSYGYIVIHGSGVWQGDEGGKLRIVSMKSLSLLHVVVLHNTVDQLIDSLDESDIGNEADGKN
ncbi:hypothetical protein D3C77_373710 [compost metagenome]